MEDTRREAAATVDEITDRYEAAIVDAKQRNKALGQRLSEERAATAEAMERIEKLLADQAAVRTENERLRAEAEHLRSSVAPLTARIERMTATLEEASSRTARAEAEQRRLASEGERLAGELAAASNERVREMLEDEQRVRAELEERCAQLEEEIEDRKVAVEAAEGRLAEMHAIFEEIRAEGEVGRHRRQALEWRMSTMLAPLQLPSGEADADDAETSNGEPPTEELDMQEWVEVEVAAEAEVVTDVEADADAEPPEAEQPPDAEAETPHKLRLPGRRRGKRGPFISKPGSCSVCSTTLQVGSSEELAASGWTIHGATGLCADCKEAGWELPDAGHLPYRRPGTEARSS
jgi:chromosome segregation protein